MKKFHPTVQVNAFELQHPFKRDDGSIIKRLDLRRLNFSDLEAMENAKTNLQASRIAITRVCSLSPDEVGRMDAADFNALDQELAGFMFHQDSESSSEDSSDQ